MLQRVSAGEMPPEDAESLSKPELTSLLGSLTADLNRLAEKLRDDPGKVAMPRLTPYEYRNAIRDLSGGVSSIYYGTVSWSSPNTPIAPEVYPRAVFDRLFDTSSLLRDRSVLDAVPAQSKDIRRHLGVTDHRIGLDSGEPQLLGITPHTRLHSPETGLLIAELVVRDE